uniref:Uncharacterized protein n=1 Tax=Chelydra serpentina TaxID=8475 RepID=A0A8C3XV08_CHESE
MAHKHARASLSYTQALKRLAVTLLGTDQRHTPWCWLAWASYHIWNEEEDGLYFLLVLHSEERGVFSLLHSSLGMQPAPSPPSWGWTRMERTSVLGPTQHFLCRKQLTPSHHPGTGG